MKSGSEQIEWSDGGTPAGQWRLAFELLFEPNPSHVALIGLDGTVLAVNAAWRRYARGNGVAAGYEFVGQNYLGVCETAIAAGERSGQPAYLGLLGVLRSGRPKFTLAYTCVSGDAGGRREQWFRMWVEPQTPSVPAVIVAHQLLFDRPTRDPVGALRPLPDGWSAPAPGGWDAGDDQASHVEGPTSNLERGRQSEVRMEPSPLPSVFDVGRWTFDVRPEVGLALAPATPLESPPTASYIAWLARA